MNSKLITITLTPAQLDMLADTLEDTTDCGPLDEGWQSAGLIELKRVIESYKLESKMGSNNE